MRRSLRSLFAMGIVACSTSSGGPGPADAAKDGAGDADAEDAASSTCSSGLACQTANDCARSRGGVAGCWGCYAQCCVPNPKGNDPTSACASGGTPCTPSTCDGAGACTGPQSAPDGTPCGQMCGGVFIYTRAACRSGVCVGDASSQTACSVECYGDFSPCDVCDPKGCTASCTPLARADRCF